jgi:hypothetical protein
VNHSYATCYPGNPHDWGGPSQNKCSRCDFEFRFDRTSIEMEELEKLYEDRPSKMVRNLLQEFVDLIIKTEKSGYDLFLKTSHHHSPDGRQDFIVGLIGPDGKPFSMRTEKKKYINQISAWTAVS